jgi:hypothetical protein
VQHLTIGRSIGWKTLSGYFFPSCGHFVQKLLHSILTCSSEWSCNIDPGGRQ